MAEVEATKKKPWADGPFKLVTTPRSKLNGKPETPLSKNVSEMCLIHNVILRGLNSIYHQCTSPLISSDPRLPTSQYYPSLLVSFLHYCKAFSVTLHSHHDTEEDVYFPLLEKMSKRKGVEKQNHDEHQTFTALLGQYDEYVNEVLEERILWDGGVTMRALIDKLGPKAEAHLHNEIDLMLSLEGDEGIDWVLMGKTMAAQSKKVADRIYEVPFLVTNGDLTYEGGIHGIRFPPFPWAVHQLFRWWYMPKLEGTWQFASCDSYSQPQELPYA